MKISIKPDNFNTCVIINSTAYFLIAYYLVVFSFNLFSMLIAHLLGFDVELFYYGFTHSGKQWTFGDLILVFFVGNAFTILTAVLFEFLYRKQRRYIRNIKMLFLWIYLISITWFFGNIIVGAVFNFGIGTALRAYSIPFLLRVLLAMVAIFAMMYFGYRSRKHIRVSANLYYPKLSRRDTPVYYFNNIAMPMLIGLIIVVLLKIPHVARYNYADIYLLFSFVFFIAGLYYNRKRLETIVFKVHNTGITKYKRKECGIFYFPLIIMVIVLLIISVGLINCLAF